MGKPRSNVRAYRKPAKINIGLAIFFIIFVYILICIWIYLTTPQIVAHEVNIGTLTSSTRYTGFIVREETTITSEYDGYINYFVRESERVGVGNLVCTIDETGTLYDYITEASTESSLQSSQDYDSLRREIVQFVSTYDDYEFNTLYDFKYNLSGTIQKLSNSQLLEQIEQISSQYSQSMNACLAPITGIVVYNTDGYESFTEDLLSADLFDQSLYEKEQYLGNELVIQEEPIYKVITSEEWSVYMQLDADVAATMEDGAYVEVRFLETQTTSWAQIYLLTIGDEIYGRLDFNNSMIQFASDRYINFELILEDDTGFKIPQSAIVEMEFYLIPKEYIIAQGSSTNLGVMQESYLEDGTQTQEFIEVTIYNESDTDYYISSDSLSSSDYIVMPDSTETYPISKRGSLIGVYNMNKGYADFTQVTILYENEEYAIVEPNTKYGLTVYDYIVLDADAVEENDFIY
ncbi:MAG: HlyD family efflux transporter periplasmic adaptor subunit [Eubacteriales bacterium]